MVAQQGNIPCYREHRVFCLQKELSSRFATKVLEYRLSLAREPVTLKNHIMPFQKHRLIQACAQLMVTHILKFQEHTKWQLLELASLLTGGDLALICVVAS